jgi:type II secretory pathway component PulF
MKEIIWLLIFLLIVLVVIMFVFVRKIFKKGKNNQCHDYRYAERPFYDNN